MLSSHKKRSTRGGVKNPNNTYILLALVGTFILLTLYLTSVFSQDGSSYHSPTQSSRTTFVYDPNAQALAEKIMELNGLDYTKPTSSPSATTSIPSQPTAPLFPVLTPSRPISPSIPSAPSILPATPKLTSSDYDDSHSDGPSCPPVRANDADVSIFGSSSEVGVTHTLPPIPHLYEPRAPKALWMLPIPLSADHKSPTLFNVDPLTGESTTKTVYHLLGTTGAAMDPESSPRPTNHLQVNDPNFAPRGLLHADFFPPLQPTCPQQAIRTIEYWHAWSKQQQEERPLNVLVWHGTWRHTTTQAKVGGPMGELGLFTSTLLALSAMSAKVTLLTHPEGEGEMIQALKNFRSYDIILIDTYSAEVIEKNGFMVDPDLRCRIRALDYWGTPARQNNWGLPDLRQYLVPFACTRDHSTPNTLLLMHRFKNLNDQQSEDFRPTPAMRERDAAAREVEQSLAAHALSFAEARLTWPDDPDAFEPTANIHATPDTDPLADVIPNPTSSDVGSKFRRGELSFTDANRRVYAKKFQILIWGKEPRYFQGLTHILRAIAEVVPMVTIVKKEGMVHFPDVSDLPKDKDSNPRIRHLGILNQEEMKQYQMESALLMGVGDPIFSFTPLESLQVGTPYLNPNFNPPKAYWMNGDCVITSQHPYAERLGAPQTWNYNIHDSESTKKVVRTALKWIRDTQTRLGGIPALYPNELTYPNLVRRLNQNFRMDFCQASGRPSTPAHNTLE